MGRFILLSINKVNLIVALVCVHVAQKVAVSSELNFVKETLGAIQSICI